MPRVFDADGHICEPPAVWTEYADPAFRDRVLQVRTLSQPWAEVFAEGRGLGFNPAPACIVGRIADDVDWSHILPGSHEPRARLAVMAEEGIDEACFFPSLYLLYGDLADPETAAATCRAYNRWIADFCRCDPARLHAVGLVPLQSPELAIAEARRIVALGLRGLAIRPERFAGLALYDPSLDRLWRIAEEANVPICVHGSFGTRMPSFATSRYENTFFTHMICHPFEQMAAVLDLVGGGVLDRFPRLRVGFFESGLGWLPYWLHRLDEHFEVMGHLVPALRRPERDLPRAVLRLDGGGGTEGPRDPGRARSPRVRAVGLRLSPLRREVSRCLRRGGRDLRRRRRRRTRANRRAESAAVLRPRELEANGSRNGPASTQNSLWELVPMKDRLRPVFSQGRSAEMQTGVKLRLLAPRLNATYEPRP